MFLGYDFLGTQIALKPSFCANLTEILTSKLKISIETQGNFSIWTKFFETCSYDVIFFQLLGDSDRTKTVITHYAQILLKFSHPSLKYQSKHKKMFQNRRNYCNILSSNHVHTILFSLNFQGTKIGLRPTFCANLT